MQVIDENKDIFTLGNDGESPIWYHEMEEQIQLYWNQMYNGKIKSFHWTVGLFVYILIEDNDIYKVDIRDRNRAEMDYFGALPKGITWEVFKSCIETIAVVQQH
jgi:hypothetical protein